MSKKHPCKPGAGRRTIIFFLCVAGFSIVLCTILCLLGLFDTGQAVRLIVYGLIGDGLICLYRWYFGYM